MVAVHREGRRRPRPVVDPDGDRAGITRLDPHRRAGPVDVPEQRAEHERVGGELRFARTLAEQAEQATRKRYQASLDALGELPPAERDAELSQLAESAYGAGEGTLLELLDAYESEADLRLARIDLQWEARRAAIELQPDLMRYTVDVTAGLAFGADINTIESGDDVIQQHLDKVLPALFRRVYSPLPRWMPLPGERGLAAHLKALAVAVQEFIAQARARIGRDPSLRQHPTNLIEAMIAARDNPDSGVNDGDVAGNVLTMLLAGEDTTANTLAWMIYLLYRNPQAQARVLNGFQAARPGAMWVVPFGNQQRMLSAVSPESHRIVLYRRQMARIGCALAERRRAGALVTGDSLGQVSSQTLTNMALTEDASTLPVLRPLLAIVAASVL